jgi:tetratricopeptide (TPR) repeat protein
MDQLDEATLHYQALLQHHPDHALAKMGMARIANRHGRHDEALGHLVSIANAATTRKAANNLLAEIHARLGNKSAAQMARSKAADFPRDDSWPDPLADDIARQRTGLRVGLAQADQLLSAGRIEESLAILGGLLRDYPQEAWAYVLVGRAQLEQGDFAAAADALRQALQLAPESPQAHFYLGVALHRQGDVSGALSSFRRAVECEPAFAVAHYNIGSCLIELGDADQAMNHLRTALRCRPDYAPAHEDLGLLLADSGEMREAIVHLREAIRLNPNREKARARLRELGGTDKSL